MIASQSKQRALSLVRKAGVLPVAEYIHYLRDRYRHRDDNADFLAKFPDFVPPPARAMHDAYATISYRAYWEDGKVTANSIAALIKRFRPEPENVLEWGCGSARILRHLTKMLPNARMTGSDYNAESIAWCKSNIAGIEFVLNGLTPPIPSPASAFDCIYAVSVLTHLSEEQQIKWMSELNRLLTPGGILIVTTHGVRATERLLPEEVKSLGRDGILIRDGFAEGKRCYLSYHSERYAREILFSRFNVAEFIQNDPTFTQDVWILTKQISMNV